MTATADRLNAELAPHQIADLIAASNDVVRPIEVVSPAEFAELHRVVVGGPFSGKWNNENGPYLVDLMNAVAEALATGKHVVCIKGAQQGVTEAFLNVIMWLLASFGGPILYLTAKDDVAKKISRNRWDPAIKKCELLRKKALIGRMNGSLILEKRFTDASLTLSGSQSGLNFISNPYAVVLFDEYDSCQDEMADGADPIATIMERMTALAEGRPVVMIAFAHPTTRQRGAAKLYYESSDQRRAHVICPHCGKWWAPLWREHVKVLPKSGQVEAEAKRDPSRYVLVHDDGICGAEISEADRLKMIQRVEQRSTLEPELAATKDWIGLHVWHLFMRKAGSVPRLAKKFIAGLDDPGKAIAFDNKVCGDSHEIEEHENPDEDAWRACTTNARFTGDTAPYQRGEIPPEVSVVTAGTDHNSTELHWAIWGWGFMPANDGTRVRCGWLIDWGSVKRDPPTKTLDAADLMPFQQRVYQRTWKRPGGFMSYVSAVGHDSGWLPDGVYEFADQRAPRGVAIKGGNDDGRSRNPLLRWGKKPTRSQNGVEVPWRDERLALVNTFLAKRILFGLVRRRFLEPGGQERWRLHLPVDVDEEVVRHLSSENLAKRGKQLVWVKDASIPNHLSDCSLYAYALAEQTAASQNERTSQEIANASEAAEVEEAVKERPRESWKIGRRDQ